MQSDRALVYYILYCIILVKTCQAFYKVFSVFSKNPFTFRAIFIIIIIEEEIMENVMNASEFTKVKTALDTYTSCLDTRTTSKDEIFRILEVIFDLGYAQGKKDNTSWTD